MRSRGVRRAVEVRLELVDREVVVRVRTTGRYPIERGRPDLRPLLPLRGNGEVDQGAGIGLFVSRHLIAASNGRIWARPRAKHGVEFAFAVPAIDA